MDSNKGAILLVLAAMLLPAAGASAQTQTAEGAQQFLRTLITSKKALVDVFKRGVQVREWRYGGETQVVTINMTMDQAELVADPRSACASTVQGYKVDPSEYNLNNGGVAEIHHKTYTFDGLTPPAASYIIDWGKVRIERGGYISHMTQGGTVTEDHPSDVVSVISGNGMRLQFYSSDPDLRDRIEYAMKFLVKSCDPTADTGF